MESAPPWVKSTGWYVEETLNSYGFRSDFCYPDRPTKKLIYIEVDEREVWTSGPQFLAFKLRESLVANGITTQFGAFRVAHSFFDRVMAVEYWISKRDLLFKHHYWSYDWRPVPYRPEHPNRESIKSESRKEILRRRYDKAI